MAGEIKTDVYRRTNTNTETLSAGKTLVTTDYQFQYLDPGGAGRTVQLPAEASSDGLKYYIVNTADAAESLTVQDDTPTTVKVIGQNEMGIFLCDGTTWKGGVMAIGAVAEYQADVFRRTNTNTETLSGTKSLVVTDSQFQLLDPGGAGRDVNLPAEASSEGLKYYILNTADAAEDLTVKDDTPATVRVVGQDEMGVFLCDGTTWLGTVVPTGAVAEYQADVFRRTNTNTETLSGDKTLVTTDSQYQVLDPGGASRNVDLPAEGSSEGLKYYIVNTADAAEDLTVREDAGAVTIITVSQNEMGFVICDGTTWYGMIGATT